MSKSRSDWLLRIRLARHLLNLPDHTLPEGAPRRDLTKEFRVLGKRLRDHDLFGTFHEVLKTLPPTWTPPPPPLPPVVDWDEDPFTF
jgi:hypothetical protein